MAKRRKAPVCRALRLMPSSLKVLKIARKGCKKGGVCYSGAMSKNPRAEQFRLNLKRLIRSRGMTQRQAAEDIGVPYNWLRKACNDGIAREQAANAERLKRVATFFDILDRTLLWSESLDTERPQALNSVDHERLRILCLLDELLRKIPDHPSVRKIVTRITTAISHLPDEESEVSPEENAQRQMGTLATELSHTELDELTDAPDEVDTSGPVVSREFKRGQWDEPCVEECDHTLIDAEIDSHEAVTKALERELLRLEEED